MCKRIQIHWTGYKNYITALETILRDVSLDLHYHERLDGSQLMQASSQGVVDWARRAASSPLCDSHESELRKEVIMDTIRASALAALDRFAGYEWPSDVLLERFRVHCDFEDPPSDSPDLIVAAYTDYHVICTPKELHLQAAYAADHARLIAQLKNAGA